jgi:hypothetical protein
MTANVEDESPSIHLLVEALKHICYKSSRALCIMGELVGKGGGSTITEVRWGLPTS